MQQCLVSMVESQKTVLQDTEACSREQWKNASGISVILALGMNELSAIAEPNSTPQMHHISHKLKP